MAKIIKPVAVQILEGNKQKLSRKTMQQRFDNEIKIGTVKFVITSRVKINGYALQKWRDVIGIFKSAADVEYVTSADSAMLERYCLTHAEYYTLKDAYDRIMQRDTNKKGAPATLEEKVYMFLKTGLDGAINKKLEMLTRMESELLLTPLSRIKNSSLPRKKKPQLTPLQQKGFDV
jgi:phage terminase small subunit